MNMTKDTLKIDSMMIKHDFDNLYIASLQKLLDEGLDVDETNITQEFNGYLKNITLIIQGGSYDKKRG